MDTHSRIVEPTSRTTRLARPMSRRGALRRLGALGLAATASAGALETLAWTPARAAQDTPTAYPDIQFDLGAFVPPARAIDGVLMAMPPVYTLFVTARIIRPGLPSRNDQQAFADSLATIEATYPFRPDGVFVHVSYGIPYFRRLPARLVAQHVPVFHATGDTVLQEATPASTDVSRLNPGIIKQSFNVPVRIETNDILFTLRGDSLANLRDMLDWLTGSGTLRGQHVASPAFAGLFRFTSVRTMFVQIGLPRLVAEQHKLPYAGRMNPLSPMWMGFFSQQTNGFGPAEIATFQGNSSARFTGMRAASAIRQINPDDYFYNGSIQVLAHDILDLAQWYADDCPYIERVQLMYRSNPIPAMGYTDQFTDGGGPAALANPVVLNAPDGTSDAAVDAATNFRLGHLQALQRATRAPDGTIVPQRVDGPGFDAMDVPDGSPQPKLQFSVFLPSAQNFAKARRNAGAADLCPHQVPQNKNGIEPFMTATRRQNFLCPPRRHRSFPLLELS